MSVITLTTDLGTKDFYLSTVRGRAAQIAPNFSLVDISHSISPFNISEAAFILKNAYTFFPKGSVHLVSVEQSSGKRSRTIAIAKNGHYFIGPDNGLFSLVIGEVPDRGVSLNDFPLAEHFSLRDVMLPAAVQILMGEAIEAIGSPIGQMDARHLLQPTLMGDKVTGSIVYINRYGNAVSNINKELFLNRNLNSVEIYFSREQVVGISKDYFDVPQGEKLCLFNSSGYLEIAINQGNAHQLLGVNLKDNIQVIFA